MKGLICIFLLSIFTSSCIYTQDPSELDSIIEQYEDYKVQAIKNKRFKHALIKELLMEFRDHPDIQVEQAGTSIEGKEIYHVILGKGSQKILAWSQMHGNEPTATMALMDILQFFTDDSFNDWKKKLLKNVSIHLIPMLNPDGADRYKRQNALDIDLNRDAQRLQSPESKLLKNLRDEIEPDFGFNLHDQGRSYAAGKSGKPATISFLAPAYDEVKSINKVRRKAMNVISVMVDKLEDYIPGNIAKYNDAYEARAFGDRIQGWGTSTILIESGGYPEDRQKQYLRKINFIALLTAFESIATKEYKKATLTNYENLPYNYSNLYDLIIREATLERDGQSYLLDIGINYKERPFNGEGDVFLSASINYIGDLSNSKGYRELNVKGLIIEEGKIFSENENTSLEQMDFPSLIKQGYTFVRLAEPSDTSYSPYALNLIDPEALIPSSQIQLYNKPNFILRDQSKFRYTIINGMIYNHLTDENDIENALIFR